MEFKKIVDIKRVNFIVDALKANLPEGAEVLDAADTGANRIEKGDRKGPEFEYLSECAV